MAIRIQKFEVSPFSENMYLLINDTNKNCWIIDPGIYTPAEENQLKEYISTQQLKPTRLLLTHAHLDHVFGCSYIHEQYGLLPEYHQDEQFFMDNFMQIASQYGIPVKPLPGQGAFLAENTTLDFDGTALKTIKTPGHSPGSLCFYSPQEGFLIAGDVLFKGSIGRTDLPGGDYQSLIHSVTSKLWKLADKTIVYPGHGPHTTIGVEKTTNPFFNS